MSGANLPYRNLLVLDLSQGIAGPGVAGLLARQGAEVVKVEPFSGDWARVMGGGEQGITALSAANNFGKKSIAVDASSPVGRGLIRRMASQADVLVESFRPGVMDKLGLSHETLCADNPRLIYLSISGFGSSGPHRDMPGADSVVQAISGMMMMNRDPDGTPRRVGMPLVDAASSVYGAQAVGVALYDRASTGKGRHIEVTLLAVAAHLQSVPLLDERMHAGQARPPLTVPSGTFRTADGLVNLTALRDRMFFGIARAIGRPDWESHEPYRTNALRLVHAEEINQALTQVLATRPTAYWLERFAAEDVLCAPVLDYAGFIAHPQARDQQIFSEIAQRGVESGPLPVPGVPGFVQEMPAAPAPLHNEHASEVLARFGLDEAEQDALMSQGAVLPPSACAARSRADS